MTDFFTEREGSKCDVERLRKTFQKIRFKLFKDQVHTNLSKEEIRTLVREYTQDKSQLARFAFIMCHGNEANKLKDINGQYYNFHDVIVEQFRSNNAPHLENVLKLLAIQACR